jgi:hypothetical protein
MKAYIKDLLKEGSTMRGLIWCIGAFGIYNISPEQSQAVTSLVMALAVTQGMFFTDKIGNK